MAPANDLHSNSGSLARVGYFVQLSALTLLFSYSIIEVRFIDLSVHLLSAQSLLQDFTLKIPYAPFLSIKFASFGWYPAFVKIFFFLSMLAATLWPFKRWVRIAAVFAIILRLLSSHLDTGVHLTTFYLLPFLLLVAPLNTEDQALQVKRRLVTAFACMYFFSAFSKLNLHYLSGDVLRFDRLNRETTKGLIDGYGLFPLIALGGIVCEFMGSLMATGRFRKIALAFIFAFHFGVGLWISLSFRLQVASAALLLFFLPDTRLKRFFEILVYTLVIHALSEYAVVWLAKSEFPNYATLILDLHGIAFGIWVFLLSIFYLFRFSMDTKGLWVLPVGVAALAYAGAAYFLSWPESFGYTQYSGRARPYYGVSVANEWLKDRSEFDSFNGRWSLKVMRNLFENETTILFPFNYTRTQFERYLCEAAPTLTFFEIESQGLVNVDTRDPDREKIRRLFADSKLSRACE